MRKVKVLALLLAALMVVAVFAGCADTDAIVADVDSLDERVTALEELLNNQKDAIDDVKDQLGDVSDKLDDDTTAAQLEAVLKALEEQQKANAELQDQIKDLANKVTKVEEDNKESSETADDDAALQAAVKVYTAKLQELKITCELSKDDYVPADYTAVVKALSDAIVAIADAEKAADVEKLYNDAKAIYDAKATVYSKLINYYNTVRNAITADSKDLVAEIVVFLDGDAVNLIPSAVNTVYPTLPAKVTAYKNGDKNADGTDVTINLVEELRKAIAAYNYLVGTTFKNNVAAAIAAIKAIDVVTIDTAGIAEVSNAKAAYAAVANEVNGLTSVNAKYIADSALALVTNAADLTAAEARLNQLTVAKAMYDTLGTVSGGVVASPFKGYNDLTVKVDYQKKSTYDAIDNVLATWINAYALEADNVKIIVDEKEGAGFYAQYVADKHVTALCVKAYSDFAAIANKVAALNKVTTVAASALSEYKGVTDAIEAWKVLQKADTTVVPNIPKIVIDDYNFNLILAAYGFEVTTESANMTKETFYYGLYEFAVTEVDTFFATQYASIDAEVKAINKNIKKLVSGNTASSKYTDIKRHVALEGLYEDPDGDGNYTKKTAVTVADTATIDGTSLTLAAFTKKYEAYDLTSLLNLADFESAKATAIERIAGFKDGATNIKTLVDAVDYLALIKTDDVTYAVAPEDAAEGTVYYYVNLNDADAIAKANAAYTAWVNKGASSYLQEWVPAVDEDGEVIPDTYTFAPIADAEALRALKQMNEDIAELKADAAKLVAHFELVAEVWNAVKANVDLAADENTADVEVLSLQNAVLDGGVVNKVVLATPVVISTESAYTISFNGNTYNLAKKGATVDATTVTAAATLQEIIDAGYNAYQAFLSKNAEITLKTSNGQLVLNTVKRVDDASVAAAVKGIAAAELVMVKDWAMDTLKGTEGLEATTVDYYCNWISEVTSLNDMTGNSLWTVAQEIYAKTGVQLGNYTRGTEIKVWGKPVSDYTQAFRAPVYANLG